MKIQRGNDCIMLFKWEWCYLILLDTKENANLLRVDMAVSALISGNYLSLLGVTFRHVFAETTTARCSWKKAAQKM